MVCENVLFEAELHFFTPLYCLGDTKNTRSVTGFELECIDKLCFCILCIMWGGGAPCGEGGLELGQVNVCLCPSKWPYIITNNCWFWFWCCYQEFKCKNFCLSYFVLHVLLNVQWMWMNEISKKEISAS